MSRNIIPQKNLLAFILLTSCFAFWGLANNMTDVLLATFKKIMSMSDFQTSWIQIAFYGSYFCLALPAAWFIKKYSYKSGVVLGLSLYSLGALMFYPSSIYMEYWLFLFSLYILAGGLSILETSANPYIISMGPADTGTLRLNFAQSFNPLGSITGILIGKYFILSELNDATASERANMSIAELKAIQSSELAAVMEAYTGVAILIILLTLAIVYSKFPRGKDESNKESVFKIFARIFKIKKYAWGVFTQTFYVGAQIGVWSFTIRYIMQNIGCNEADASTYYLISIILFSASRFIGTGMMLKMSPNKVLAIFSSLGIFLCFMTILFSNNIGAICLIGISGAMSIMFPTIYGIALGGLGEDTKVGASGLIMAIIGGAIFTALQGKVSDSYGVNVSFVVPLICLFMVLIYALKWSRIKE